MINSPKGLNNIIISKHKMETEQQFSLDEVLSLAEGLPLGLKNWTRQHISYFLGPGPRFGRRGLVYEARIGPSQFVDIGDIKRDVPEWISKERFPFPSQPKTETASYVAGIRLMHCSSCFLYAEDLARYVIPVRDPEAEKIKALFEKIGNFDLQERERRRKAVIKSYERRRATLSR